jgi:hypothetical protein
MIDAGVSMIFSSLPKYPDRGESGGKEMPDRDARATDPVTLGLLVLMLCLLLFGCLFLAASGSTGGILPM